LDALPLGESSYFSRFRRGMRKMRDFAATVEIFHYVVNTANRWTARGGKG